MSIDIISQLKKLKHDEINPRPDWVATNRNLLLSQIKNTVSANQTPDKSISMDHFWSYLSVFIPKGVVYNVVRPVAVLMVVVLVGTSGWIASVDAADNALPGDGVPYLLKRSLEKTQVAVVTIIGDSTDEAKIHAKLAGKRALETEQISKTNNPKQAKKLAASVMDLKSEITTVNSKLEAVKNNNKSSKSAAKVKAVQQDTAGVKNVLKEVKKNLLAGEVADKKIISKQLSETRNLAADANVNAVEVLVGQHLDGDNSVSTAEVTAVLTATLKSAVKEAGEASQSAAVVKQAVDAVQSDLVNLTNEIGQNGAGADSAGALTKKIQGVSNETVAAVLKTEAAAVTVGQDVEEALGLLANGDLVKVVDKIKETSATNKEAEKISDQAVVGAQQILPIVQVVKDDDLTSKGVVEVVPGVDPLLPLELPATKMDSSTMFIDESVLKGDESAQAEKGVGYEAGAAS